MNNAGSVEESGTGAERPVLVLGGGVNGAAVARELLLNGLSVVLVDRADLNTGATAGSSRLVHGGLRYLEYADFALVREALAERDRLLRLAPQFVRPLRLFIPVERWWSGGVAAAARLLGAGRWAGRRKPAGRGYWIVRTGLALYQRLGGGASSPGVAVHRPGEPGVPPVDPGRFRRLCSYYDGQMELPERFVIALLRDAQAVAAAKRLAFRVLTYRRVERAGRRIRLLPRDAPRLGRPAGVVEVAPRAIVNATGAWVDATLRQLDIASPRLIGGTKGSHLLTSHGGLRAAIGDDGVYAEAPDGRPVFILPLGRFALIGTTDLPIDGDPDAAATDRDEVRYLLDAAARVFPHVPLQAGDVDATCCGVRPLPFQPRASPAAVTRRHWLEETEADDVPVWSLVGGKLTTCRRFAEEAAAAVCRRLGVSVAEHSRRRPVPGAAGYEGGLESVTRRQEALAKQLGFTSAQVRAAWRLAGSLAGQLLAPDGSPRGGGGRATVPGLELPERVVRRLVRQEWCGRLSDLVLRRLVLPFTQPIELATIRRLGELMCEEGVLDARTLDSEIACCCEELARRHGIRPA